MPGREGARAASRRALRPGPTVRRPRSCSFAAVTRPTPQSRSTGSGWRNPSSSSGGTTSRPFGFATAARHLREELRSGDADRDRQPDLVEHPPRGAAPRSRWRSREPLEPANVEERLVDREPLDERRGVLEDREHRLARLRVRGHPRADDDRVRAEPPRLPAAHRRPDRRTPSPRSSPRARPRLRRSPVDREAVGSSRCSTAAKKASRSAWRIVAASYEHMFAATLGEQPRAV